MPRVRPEPPAPDLRGATARQSASGDLLLAERITGETTELLFVRPENHLRPARLLASVTLRADGDPIVAGSIEVGLADRDRDGATDARIAFVLQTGPAEDVAASFVLLRRGDTMVLEARGAEDLLRAAVDAAAPTAAARLRAAETAFDAFCTQGARVCSPVLPPPCTRSAILMRTRLVAAIDAAAHGDGLSAAELLDAARQPECASIDDAAALRIETLRLAAVGAEPTIRRLAILLGPLAATRGPLDPRLRWQNDGDSLEIDLAAGTQRFSLASGAGTGVPRPALPAARIGLASAYAVGLVGRCGTDAVVVCDRPADCRRCLLQVGSAKPGCDPSVGADEAASGRLVATSADGRVFVAQRGRLSAFRLDGAGCTEGRVVLGTPAETTDARAALAGSAFDPAARFGLWAEAGRLWLVELTNGLRTILLGPVSDAAVGDWPPLAEVEAIAVAPRGDRAALIVAGTLWTIDLNWAGGPTPPERSRPSDGSAPSRGGSPSRQR